jgi:hypothetical protein
MNDNDMAVALVTAIEDAKAGRLPKYGPHPEPSPGQSGGAAAPRSRGRAACGGASPVSRATAGPSTFSPHRRHRMRLGQAVIEAASAAWGLWGLAHHLEAF